MRLRERDEHLDPEDERELDAIERALSGRPVDPDLADWAELANLIADERPDPDPRWSAELDEQAAARFRGAGSSRSPLGAFERFKPRQLLPPAGALASAAVIAIVGISTLGGQGTGDDSATSSDEAALSIQSDDAGSAAIPDSTASSGAAEAAPEQGLSDETTLLPPEEPIIAPDVTGSLDARDSDKIAPGRIKRQVERDVALTLSTRPEGVRDVSDEAIAITRSFDGIVTSSQVSSAGRQASATLQLTIPTRNLDAALDQLTGLANVKSLDEATLDITRPYVSAQDTLRDAEAERRSLLEALGNATTDAEAEALRLQIADARRTISQAEAAFENIARRARLSQISLSIVGDPMMEDDRSIGDWFDDAVSVLRDVAGVLLISAAIVVPLGILLGLGWLVVSRIRRRRRERALD